MPDIQSPTSNFQPPTGQGDNLLEVDSLVKYFPVRGGILQRTIAQVQAVEDVSFAVKRGETLGLVGESGCGKTTIGRMLVRLIEPTSGSIRFEGRDILPLKGADLKALRSEMQIIFQDPFSSLDPRTPVGESIGEGLLVHGVKNARERQRQVLDILSKVGLEGYHAKRYPHEFSGGQRQRIGIARALVLRPKFLVCDEPVSALDVSIQSQVLNLLRDLQKDFGLTYIFIAHNMSVVEHISDRVAVMYLGKLVELSDRIELYRNPQHPYTQALMSAIPVPNPKLRRERTILKGDVPSPLNPPTGCRFHPRCPVAIDICSRVEPPLLDLGGGHMAACHLRQPANGAGISQPASV
jgi:peptide/nickel transport system ATP-binding protein/oligopeptide transport system ATP-binding protein